jgi:hypothetical protein
LVFEKDQEGESHKGGGYVCGLNEKKQNGCKGYKI